MRLDYHQEFRPYQMDGLRFLHHANGRAGLGDDVGMGKSAQALAYMVETPRIKKVLIVTKASALYKWQREVSKWTGRTSEVIEGRVPQLTSNSFIHITGWANLAGIYLDLRQFQYDLIIFDESHKAKNVTSDRTKASMRLAKGVPHLLFLSASPMPRRRDEMWTMLHMIDPARWGTLTWFRNEYCNDDAGAKTWKVSNMADVRKMQARNAEINRRRLAEDILPYFLRRQKSEHLQELGQPTRVYLPMRLPDNKLGQDYRTALSDLYTYLRINGKYVSGKIPAKALRQLGILRRIIGRVKAVAAIDLAENLLEADETASIVIYAIHKDVVASIEKALGKYGLGTIDGSTPNKTRDDLQVAFQARELRVMVISEAGEEAIDLFAAQNIIFAERGWNPASEDQAIGRLHRIGQAGLVTAHVPLVEHTIDMRLDAILTRKRTEVKEVIGLDEYNDLIDRELLASLVTDPL